MSITDTPILTFNFAAALLLPDNVLQFSGNTSVDKDSVVNFPVNGLCFSFWLKTDSTANQILLSYDADAPDNSHRLYLANPSNLELHFGAGSTGPTGISINDNIWHHLAVNVFPTGLLSYGIEIFRDGTSEYMGFAAIAHPFDKVLETNGQLVLGKGVSAEAGYIGLMSEFRLWRHTRTGDEIMTDMQTRVSDSSEDIIIVWALSSPSTSGTLENATFVGSDLCYRTFTMTASWTAVSGATYNLQVNDVNGSWCFIRKDINTTSLPVTGFLLNKTYSAKVQATVAGTPGPWSEPVTITAMSLQQPQITLSQPTPNTMQASWQNIDQAQSYIFSKQAVGGDVQTIQQSGITMDITDIATGDPAYDFMVNALSMGSGGPDSDKVSLNPLTLSLTYFNTEGRQYFKANWNAATASSAYYYLQIFKNTQTGTPVFSAFYKDVTTADISGIGFETGVSYYSRIRCIGAGKISAYSPWAQVKPFTVNAPVISSVSSDATALSISLNWTFDNSPYAAVSYRTELLNDQQGTPALLSANVTDKNYTFTNPPGQVIIKTNTYYYVRVRATADHVDSPFSQASGIGVATISPVTNIQLTASNEGLISASWSSSETGATFKAAISIDGTLKATHDDIPTTTTGFAKSETSVVIGNTYTVKVEVWTKKNQQTSISQSLTKSLKIESSDPPRPDPPSGGDPVNLVTGSYRYSHMDIGINCAEPISFITYYGTDYPLPGENPLYSNKPLGNRWNHYYNTRIASFSNGSKVAVIWANGYTDTYLVPPSITGNYTAELAPCGNTLQFNSNNQYILTTKKQEVWRFDAYGRLTGITSAIGNTISLLYTNNQLAHIKLDETHFLDLTYTNNGFLETVTDPLGRRITYTYLNDCLKSVIGVMGAKREFTYNDNSLVITITDENSHTFIKNEYDDQQRVKYQWDARALASGENYCSTFLYTTVKEGGLDKIICDFTDRAGNKATYKSFKDNESLDYAIWNLGTSGIRRQDQVHDGFGNLLSETIYEGPEADWAEGKGNKTVYEYDGNNNVLSITYALNNVIRKTYDSNNILTSETDINDNTVTYLYEGNLLQQVIDPLGRTTVFTFRPGATKGLIETLTDVNGNTTSFIYENGYLKQGTDPFGNRKVYTNDTIGRVHTESIYDKNNNLLRITTNEYYANNVLKKKSVQYNGQSAADAFVWQFTTDNTGNITSETDPEGNTVSYLYNPNDFLEKITYPVFNSINRQTTYQYDRIDNLSQKTCSPVVVEHYQYDQLNRLKQFIDPNLNQYLYDYIAEYNADKSFNLKQQTTFPKLTPDATDILKESSITDPIGRIVKHVNKAGVFSTIAYSKQAVQPGRYNTVLTLTLPPAAEGQASFTVSEVYDAALRRIAVTNQAGNSSNTSYTTKQDAATGTQQQVIIVTDPLGNQQISVLDANGLLANYKEGKDTVWVERNYTYDALGRLLQTDEKTNTGFISTQFTYSFDATAKRVKVTAGRPGDNTALCNFLYNGNGQLVSESDPLNNTTLRSYSPWGGLMTYTNARNQVQTYGFDEAGRFNKITLPGTDGNISHILDGNGNRTQTQINGTPDVTRTFDPWNRLKIRTNTNQETVGYQYSSTDQLQTLIYPDSKQVSYEYDNLYRMTKVTDWSNRSTQYTYNPTGTASTITYPNACIAAYTFDKNDRLTGLEHKSGDVIVTKLSMILDPLGNPATNKAIFPLPPVLEAGVQTLIYNKANQLTKFNSIDLTYDEDGNQLSMIQAGASKAVNYDIFNRVSAIGADSYRYDTDSLRAQTTLAGVTQNYVFDCRGYQSPMLERADPSRCVINRYEDYLSQGGVAYNAVTADAGNIVPFTGALDHLLELRNAQRAVQKRYVYGLSLIGSESVDGSLHIHHCDHLGNTMAISDAGGNLTGKIMYDNYGQANNRMGDTNTPFLFSGGYGVMDDANGQLYSRARSYASRLARFMQKDFLFGDITMPQTLNRYSYVTGNPVSYLDPLGLSKGKDIAIGIGIGVAVGAVGGGIFGAIFGYFAGGGAGAVAGAITGALGGALGGAIGGGIGGAIGGAVGGTAGGAIGGVTGGGIGGAVGGMTARSVPWLVRAGVNILRFFRHLRVPARGAYQLISMVEF